MTTDTIDSDVSAPTWLDNENIRPYVLLRSDNRIENPGSWHSGVTWFKREPLHKDPLRYSEADFAVRVFSLDQRAFGPIGLTMPKWVFFDCAVIPGLITGFAARTESLSEPLRAALQVDSSCEWTPLSLFIIIPSAGREGEWVAHNLCSVNAFLPKELQFYGIGFISKAFGLWYANVKTCMGMTQWGSPSLRLHSHYGDFEIVSAYTKLHSYERTLTYRVRVDASTWQRFFDKQECQGFKSNYSPAGFFVDPRHDESLIKFQARLDGGEGRFFLDSAEITAKGLDETYQVYRKH